MVERVTRDEQAVPAGAVSRCRIDIGRREGAVGKVLSGIGSDSCYNRNIECNIPLCYHGPRTALLLLQLQIKPRDQFELCKGTINMSQGEPTSRCSSMARANQYLCSFCVIQTDPWVWCACNHGNRRMVLIPWRQKGILRPRLTIGGVDDTKAASLFASR